MGYFVESSRTDYYDGKRVDFDAIRGDNNAVLVLDGEPDDYDSDMDMNCGFHGEKMLTKVFKNVERKK